MIKLLLINAACMTSRLFRKSFNCRYNPRMDYVPCLLTLTNSEKWRSPLFGATGNFNHQILPYDILFLTFINTNVFYSLSFKFSSKLVKTMAFSFNHVVSIKPDHMCATVINHVVFIKPDHMCVTVIKHVVSIRPNHMCATVINHVVSIKPDHMCVTVSNLNLPFFKLFIHCLHNLRFTVLFVGSGIKKKFFLHFPFSLVQLNA